MATKSCTFSIRILEEDRYAVELLQRKYSINVSQIILKSLLKTFEDEGLTTAGDDGLSMLDKLWCEDGSERLERLAKLAPQFLTRDEKRLMALAKNGI